MLPQSKRLTKNHFATNRPKIVFRGNLLDIAVVTGTSDTRFACIIAKKKIRKAIDRNKVKRKIYTILRGIEVKQPLYGIIYPKPQTVTTSTFSLQEELEKGFATLH